MKKIMLLVSAALIVTASAQAQTPGVTLSTNTIAGIVAKDPQFSTLLAALKAAGLDKTLGEKGPYTVFAPTNAAFAKIPKATLDALLKNKAELTKVLTYHVVGREVMAAGVVKLKTIITLEGSRLKIKVMGKDVMLNTATVTKTDIKASNGVIHVIDTVLMPKM